MEKCEKKRGLSRFLPFNWVFTKIKESMVDHLGKPSATRINGYILTALLGLAVLVALGIEIVSAVSAIQVEGGTYSISPQLIALITLLMGHHALLFQLKRKSEETSFPTLEKMKIKGFEEKEVEKEEVYDVYEENVDDEYNSEYKPKK